MTLLHDVDPHEVAARWRDRASALIGGAPVSAITGCPPRDLARSPAAARIASLSHEAGLFCFHFEHRVHLPVAEVHVVGDPARGAPPVWIDGVLPEPKYQSFRHDLPIGSTHPGHRGKWAAHELCHGLVGFGWRAGATPFFHATAGRLAELLPVALWYWFDEVCVRRCPDHLGGGALFRTFCAACEEAQGAWPDDPAGAERVAGGIAYLRDELAAIARSRREGRLVPHRVATLDLSSDGAAYALAHGRRLASPEFARFVQTLCVSGGGWSDGLEALQERVIAVARALLLDVPLAPLAPSAAHGRARWILQDVGWRLATVRAETGGEAADGIDAMLDGLGEALSSTREGGDPAAAEAAVRDALAAYRALFDDWELPDPQDVFALGYPVEGLEAAAPLEAGLRTVTQTSLDRLGADLAASLGALEAADRAHIERVPLVDRWARLLVAERGLDDPAASLARFDAAVAAAAQAEVALPGPSTGSWRRVLGARIERFAMDVLALAEGDAVSGGPMVLGFARGADGAELVGLDAAVADALDALPGALALDPEERDALARLGLIAPLSYAEERPPPSR